MPAASSALLCFPSMGCYSAEQRLRTSPSRKWGRVTAAPCFFHLVFGRASPVLRRHLFEHWCQLIQRRTIGQESDLELRRILHQFLHVPGCGRPNRSHRRNMAYTDVDVFLRISVQVEHDRATRVHENQTAETAPVAFLYDSILYLAGPDVLELIDAHGGEVLVQGVGSAAAGRVAIVRYQP